MQLSVIFVFFYVFVCLVRFKLKMDFFVSEDDFENLFEVMGFTNVFEKGKKCNVMLCLCFFVCCFKHV